MRVKLNRSVLVGDSDVVPTPGGTELDMDDTKAKEFVTLGLAVEVAEQKKEPDPQNKKAPEPANKAARATAKGA